jgi:hypothetical protein
MTRRQFFLAALVAGVHPPPQLTVPLRIVLDTHAAWGPGQVPRFWAQLWPQAVQTFAAGGIRFDLRVTDGEVRRSPGGNPIFIGLDRGALNLVVTNQIAMAWDRARALAGVTTRYQGYHISMVALDWAHGHQIPFLSVNTCVHELLHALLGDIFEDRPEGFRGATREFRIDCYATRLWLFGDGAQVRKAAQAYGERLRWEVASRS